MHSSRMTVMKMTPEEFHAWSQRLQFTSETEALIRTPVNAVLFDEGHRLMQGGGRYTTDKQLEWLKSLTNRKNVLHVLTGPYELFRFCNTRGNSPVVGAICI